MEKILFRTSGGRIRKKELGLGHVFRCINLGYQLKSHQIQFLIEDYGSVSPLLHEHGFKKIFNLIPGISINDDIKKTVAHILKNKITILIVDKYGLTNLYVKTLKKIVRVVVISDLKNIEYDSDLVINGFIGFNNKIKTNKFKIKCLLGPKYQILNQQYAKKQHYKKKYDLLITVGGFDANNLLEIILKKISKYEKNIKIKIILGHATKNKSIISKFVTKSNEITIINKTNNMKKEISSTKFGICAGGITTYEFAALHIPFAIVCQYKHQIFTANEWHKRKIAKNLGFIQKEPKKMDVFLNHLMQNKIILNHSNLVDGLGSKRVAIEILNLTKN
ncbi:MAG: UDP-2,4-diacetamido-2,4,6-trideoxy-beta-L-altropyranose hydrolase [Thaumarchaeota archaeon]|jgi:UDP-2,4-diacetamido-2,4,6-trideoxy-beta-L-altropyranose hydrolase|nr:MAG: UDP-2,4-diacetamido-2,4,6-trideoxy-beta-L-altropyranose hydrolase [Nitrososphaerota archaeon]